MPFRSYTIWLSGTACIQVGFTSVQGRIASFVVQLFVMEGDSQRAVVRYDTAHGMPHKDLLNKTGALMDKEWLLDLSMDDALTFAIKELKAHYEDYL